MNNTKDFHARTLLTLTTGIMCTVSKGAQNNGFGDFHELVEHLAGEAVFTHQLPRVADCYKDYLLSTFPELTNISGSAIKDTVAVGNKDGDVEKALRDWIRSKINNGALKAEFYSVPRPSAALHQSIDPFVEADEMMGAS